MKADKLLEKSMNEYYPDLKTCTFILEIQQP